MDLWEPMSIASGLNPTGVAGWRWCLAASIATGASLVACAGDPPLTGSGLLSGQVVVSGPLRNAGVSIDQISLHANGEISIRAHVGDTTTNDDGRFGGPDGLEVG